MRGRWRAGWGYVQEKISRKKKRRFCSYCLINLSVSVSVTSAALSCPQSNKSSFFLQNGRTTMLQAHNVSLFRSCAFSSTEGRE